MWWRSRVRNELLVVPDRRVIPSVSEGPGGAGGSEIEVRGSREEGRGESPVASSSSVSSLFPLPSNLEPQSPRPRAARPPRFLPFAALSVGMALVVALLAACSRSAPAPTTTTGSATAAVPSGPRVVFPDGTVIQVEIAADDPTREQGLMFRDQLP